MGTKQFKPILMSMNNSPSSLSFIQAGTTDLDYITEKTLALHHFETDGGENILSVTDNFEKNIKQWLSLELEQTSSLIFIITLEQKPIGFAFLKVIPSNNNFTQYQSHGLIQSVWIDEQYQKNNYGTQTVSLIESIFNEQNIPYYEVNYARANTSAKAFWEACGMIETSATARKFLNN